MNILHITTYLQGGAGRIIENIAYCQKIQKDNVFVVTTKSEELGYCNYKEYTDFLKTNCIDCLKVDSTFKRDTYLNINAVYEVKKIIINNDIDIIHTHAAVPSMIAILARSGIKKHIPVIQTMHGWGTNKKLKHEKMDCLILNSIDKVISVSKNDKSLMISKGIYREKISTIYNGVEDNVSFTYSENDDIINDIKNYKDNGYKVFGCIGSVCERKNQQIFIETLNKIGKDLKIFAVFIGEGDKIKELKKKVNDYALNDRIKFYGYRQNASKYISFFDYFIFTSLSEGFSIAVLEGFRSKTAVIASDIPAFHECIQNNVTGYLFKSNNIYSLENLIRRVISNKDNNLEKIIIKNGYYKFKDKFTLRKMIDNYYNVYRTLLS
ncbi:glycosyltransferase [Clostridium tyrobutyricum]|uniref:glycosyltransferase n=1 Tax=Clostridium tyrobutyricum TaxID=1519 RepID=UPI0002EA233E|nr:glycosyltransferase [Clostridium tyrobutyricum]